VRWPRRGQVERDDGCDPTLGENPPAVDRSNIVEINMGDLSVDLAAVRETLRDLPQIFLAEPASD
jgi:hypothetical protein